MSTRDYDRVIAALKANPTGSSRESRMRATVDALWHELSDKGVSWVGFYIKTPGMDEMTLGPSRDKPACSPIAMFGACGQAFHNRKPLVVSDVTKLRSGYIACDPRDRSEVVVPCMNATDNQVWGVLDVDSHDTHSFTERDAFGLSKVLVHMGLHVAQSAQVVAV
jgi:putative methionine-R-sulfoxide reductase with GAF domain